MADEHFDFWFDFSCPYAYLASTQVDRLAERTGKTVNYKPMLLGGVFRGIGIPTNPNERLVSAKARHNANDMRRHANLLGVALMFHPKHPVRTVTALRVMLAAGAPFDPLAKRFFEAYWVRNLDINSPEVVAAILTEAGLDAEKLLNRAERQEIKDDLRARTDEAIELGAFGAPAFVYEDLLYWGQDRMGELEIALGGQPDHPDLDAPIADGVEIEFYFDYSSPFAYLAANRVEKLLGARVRWIPMFLGGVFRTIGTPMVPLFELNEAKQRYVMADGIRQAARDGIPYAWPSRFPMNTITALRMTIAAGSGDTDEGRNFITRVFRAYWSENEDINDQRVLSEIATEVGLDAKQILGQTVDPEIKNILRKNTETAVAKGVFGAPTVIVRNPDGREGLFWGNDRLELALRAAQGDDTLL